MAENLLQYFTKDGKFKIDKYWFRTLWVIEVYLICIIT